LESAVKKKDRWVLPNAIRINIKRSGRSAHLVYEEDFNNVAVLKRTVPLVAKRLPPSFIITVRRGGKTVRIAGCVDYAVAANMVVGEFFAWSSVAEMTLRELVLGPVVRV
jgi:hypothetical protein